MDDKWKMFKNYMHNELGITKEDIRQWVQDAVREEAKIAVNGQFNNFDVNKTIKQIVFNDDFFGSRRLKDEIRHEIGKQLLEKFRYVDDEK